MAETRRHRGAGEEAVEECLLSLLMAPGPPAQGWNCPERAGPSHINPRERKQAAGKPGEWVFSTEVPSFKMTPAWVRLA